MDRSMLSAVRLSDVPLDLNTLIETWISRFGQSSTCVQLYHFEKDDGHRGHPSGRKFEQRVAIYSDNQQYMIHARWGFGEGTGYLGCIAQSRKPRAGEDHHRGSDLTDGPFTYGTWFAILGDIVSYEMVQLAKSARPVPDGHQFPSSGPEFAQAQSAS